MRYLILFAISVVNLIFANTVFPNINIAHMAPDIIVCTIVSMTILEDSMAGAWIGLFCGLCMDLFTGIIGLNALPYFLTGSIVFFVRKSVTYVDKIMLPLLFVIGAYFLREALSALLAYMLDKQFSLAEMFVRYMLPEAIMTGLFMLLVHFVMRRVYSLRAIKKRSSQDFKRLL
jgi:rod shape-determining protein MreD